VDEEDVFPFAGIATLLLIGAMLAAGLWLRPADRFAGETTLQKIKRLDTIRIGYANEAPYGYRDGSTGQVTGEAPEIAKVIMRRMGVRNVEPVVTEFGSMIPGLKAGRFDMIAAGMYITPARCKEIAFSNPTYGIGEAFIVARGNPLDLHSFEDVARNEQAKLGVVGGAVEQKYARQTGVPDDRVVVFNDNPTGLEGVRTGRVDAFAATVLTVNDLLGKANDQSIQKAKPFHDPVVDGETVRGYGAFGFRKENQDLVEAVNQKLAEFLGTPEHLKLVRPFGFSEETLPGKVTADQLCGSQ